MELKIEYVKTIKRLTMQNQNEVLKNKLREWLLAKDFTLDDLLFSCVEGHINLSGTILNKMGTLYSFGQEGMSEDDEAAFAFFEIAAQIGHAIANGNCAQYYFDGRSPIGKDIELALYYCHKSIELGADKYMLLSEILYDQNRYTDTVQVLHNNILNKMTDKTVNERKKRIEARELERECLIKQLNRTFHNITTFTTTNETNIKQNTNINTTKNNQFSINLNENILHTPSNSHSPRYIDSTTSAIYPSPRSPLRSPRTSHFHFNLSSPKHKSAYHTTNNNTTTSNTATSVTTYTDTSSSNSASQLLSLRTLSFSPTNAYTTTITNTISNTTAATTDTTTPLPITTPHITTNLPGWVSITSELDGFDQQHCMDLTVQAQLLVLEEQSIYAALVAAREYIQKIQCNSSGSSYSSNNNNLTQKLYNLKVTEYEVKYNEILKKKNNHINNWNIYTNIDEYILYKQLYLEQQFFNSYLCNNKYCYKFANQLLLKRTENEAISDDSAPIVLNITGNILSLIFIYYYCIYLLHYIIMHTV